jgi:hypothetical protein
MFTTTTRNATLTDLLSVLQDQHARKLDVVAPATALRSIDGVLIIRGSEAVLSEDGVTTTDGAYVPTAVFDEGVADKLGVPVSYLKRLREERPDLYDANVNGWLHGAKAKGRIQTTLENYAPRPGEWVQTRAAIPADPRSFLVRAFKGSDDGPGIARALLSDRYATVDNMDVLMSCLDGVRAAGVSAQVKSGDLTDRRMVVRVSCPEVAAEAPRLLAGYRSPFTGETGADNPLVFAGFRLTNSETGGGAFTITPEVTVQVCNNGMTITRDAMRTVHLGGRLEEGVVRWAEDTQTKALELVQAKTRDAVAAFLNRDYLTATVARLEARAEEPVGTTEDAVRDLTKPLGYTQAQVTGILDYFVRGGQFTRAGVVNAVTAYSQTLEDGDAAHDLDARAVSLLGV